jgi:sulfite exporter TauE/SafE
VIALLPRRGERPIQLGRRTGGAGLAARVVSWLPRRRALALGLATAVLPCGMLVPAWLLAAGAGGAAEGALVMSAFAAASLPGLLVPLLGRRLIGRMPAWGHALAWTALAVWLAWRPVLMAAHHHHG